MGAPGPNDPHRDQPAAMNAAEKSIVVNASVAEVYERWLRFEEFRSLSNRSAASNESTIRTSRSAMIGAARNRAE